MAPRIVLAFVALLAILPAMPALLAADEPKLAENTVAKAAVEKFDLEFAAKGLKGDERLAVREKAMRELAKVQHPFVVDRLVKITKDKDADMRTLAVLYLGEQKLLPGYAGKAVVQAIQSMKGSNDAVFLMFCGDALEAIDYRGQIEVLRALIDSKHEAVRKHALVIVGEMKETRLLSAVVELMVELKIDQAVKWDGGDPVVVDTGAPGDADQQAAEAAYNAQNAGHHGKGKAAARKMRDLKPTLLHVMKLLTGQEFATTDAAKAWVAEHKAQIDARSKELAELQKEQDKTAKTIEAQLKSLR